jgi:hypothetical protein
MWRRATGRVFATFRASARVVLAGCRRFSPIDLRFCPSLAQKVCLPFRFGPKFHRLVLLFLLISGGRDAVGLTGVIYLTQVSAARM